MQAEAISCLVADGYELHLCPAACPEHGEAGHAHMTSPAGLDFIARGDGTADPFDLTRNSGIVAPVMTPQRGRNGARQG